MTWFAVIGREVDDDEDQVFLTQASTPEAARQEFIDMMNGPYRTDAEILINYVLASATGITIVHSLNDRELQAQPAAPSAPQEPQFTITWLVGYGDMNNLSETHTRDWFSKENGFGEHDQKMMDSLAPGEETNLGGPFDRANVKRVA